VKIPKSFRLAGIVWRVVRCDVITDMGTCCNETHVIRIRKDLDQQSAESTFCHELGHAIRFTAGEDDHNEQQVDAHGNLLHQFLIQISTSTESA
jgi:hypothetical protein